MKDQKKTFLAGALVLVGEMVMYLVSAAWMWRYNILTWECDGNAINYDFIVGEWWWTYGYMLRVFGVVAAVTVVVTIVVALIRAKKGK